MRGLKGSFEIGDPSTGKIGAACTLGHRLLQSFDRIYIINLACRPDRKSRIAHQFALIGIDFADPKVTLFEAIRPPDRGEWPTIGARGCFLSHLAVLKHAAAQAHGAILILEDDADWSDSFLKGGHTILDGLENHPWQFLHGGMQVGHKCPELRRLPPEQEVIFAHFVGLRGPIISELATYLEKMADRMDGDPRGGPMHVDGAYNWYRREHPDTASFMATPCIALQRPSRTDIHDLSWSDRAPLIRPLKNQLRSILHSLRKALGAHR
ncbi:MAG: glycosyltransferase family 25 protein [Sulfitobacter sp.]|nr:glycosyltransferase family 25 protein [Sulfitobacter sp.]